MQDLDPNDAFPPILFNVENGEIEIIQVEDELQRQWFLHIERCEYIEPNEEELLRKCCCGGGGGHSSLFSFRVSSKRMNIRNTRI